MELPEVRALLKRFVADTSGATAIEYALIAVIVSISIIAAVDSIGEGSVLGYFQAVIDGFASLF
jgi:pilus assembly protein Flp/PilA